jgi:dihydroneopterin aldolase
MAFSYLHTSSFDDTIGLITNHKLIMNKSVLSIKNYLTTAHLGVGNAERKRLQKVSWNVSIYDEHLPQGCYTDELSHSINYDMLHNTIKDITEHSEYKLLEHLCYKVYAKLKEITKKNIEIEAIKHITQGQDEEEEAFRIVD